MEIDLYKDLTAFNSLTSEEQQAEADRLRAATAQPRHAARVVAAPAPEPVFAGNMVVDSPGSVILRAEDILPDDEEEPQPVSKPVEVTGRKATMDDQLKVSGPLPDLGQTTLDPSGTKLSCPSCGSLSNGEDLFCISCGSFLNEPEATLEVSIDVTPVCLDCGAAVEPGEIFCPSCGSALPN